LGIIFVSGVYESICGLFFVLWDKNSYRLVYQSAHGSSWGLYGQAHGGNVFGLKPGHQHICVEVAAQAGNARYYDPSFVLHIGLPSAFSAAFSLAPTG